MNGQVGKVFEKVTHNRRFRFLMAGLIILVLVLGLAVVPIEVRSGRGGNFRTAEDGVWWAVTTMTGVGYGDLYPVTTAGRAIGVIVEVFGVLLFGSIVAIVSVELLRYQEDYYVRRMFKRTDELEMKLDEMKKQLDFLIKDKTSKK